MRVLVLGGGYAGVTLARTLERRLPATHEIVVIDDDGHHLVQHELHRVVRRPELADEITVELSDLLDRSSVLIASVEGVSPDDRTVSLSDDGGLAGDGGLAEDRGLADDRDLTDDGDLEYDACAVAIGAAPSLAVEGVAEHGVPLKRIEDARRIHERAIEVLELVESGDECRIVVGGAGLSGVQVAGELAALAAETGADPVDGGVEITLLEQEASVAPGFEAPFRAAIRAALDDRGIDVRTGTTVERATADAVVLEDGDRLPHDCLVWTGGITGQRALDGERPVVDARLRLGERTFGLGDAVRVIDRDGEAVPATAQAAVGQAETVATNVERVLEGGGTFEPRLDRFSFDPPGWVVSVGDGAVAQIGPTVVSGRAAVALKATVGVGYLSSVGARREAVDLVNKELGLDVSEE